MKIVGLLNFKYSGKMCHTSDYTLRLRTRRYSPTSLPYCTGHARRASSRGLPPSHLCCPPPRSHWAGHRLEKVEVDDSTRRSLLVLLICLVKGSTTMHGKQSFEISLKKKSIEHACRIWLEAQHTSGVDLLWASGSSSPARFHSRTLLKETNKVNRRKKV